MQTKVNRILDTVSTNSSFIVSRFTWLKEKCRSWNEREDKESFYTVDLYIDMNGNFRLIMEQHLGTEEEGSKET